MANVPLHDLYQQHGPEEYYRQRGDTYANPHEPAVGLAIEHAVMHWSRWTRPDGIGFSRVLDLAAGSGEVTLALVRLIPDCQIAALDPFTHRLYEKRTGRTCLAVSFEDIALGRYTLPAYSCILISCALHLLEESWLPGLCWALASATPDLLIITPITRPEIKASWGLELLESTSCSVGELSVRLRWYRSQCEETACPL